MDAFEKELMRRSPLAACVLEMADFVFDPPFLNSIYAQGRGRCYEDKLTFENFLALTRDALIRHEGSAHKLFVELERSGSQPIDESNYYRKLARMPVAISPTPRSRNCISVWDWTSAANQRSDGR